MKAAYYAKVIRVIAFQLKVNDAVPPFFTVPPPPDDLEFDKDDIDSSSNIRCGPSLARRLKFALNRKRSSNAAPEKTKKCQALDSEYAFACTMISLWEGARA